MNKTFKEVLIITGLACMLGILYNIFSDKPLPLMYREKPTEFVKDSELFRQLNIKIDTNNAISREKFGNNKDKHDSSKRILKNSNTANKDSSKSVETINKIRSITYKQLLMLLQNPEIVIIDARNPDDYSKEHIGNAINIFPYSEGDTHIGKIAALDRDKTYIVYCDGGECDLSHEVIKIMFSFGFKRVFLYSGGWEEWTKNQQK